MVIQRIGRGRGRRTVMAAALVVGLLTVGGGASAATPWTIDEFPTLTVAGLPNEIVKGPDGNLWFTERTGAVIGRISPAGVVAEFPIADPDPRPEGIAAGPDGNLWVALRNANAIARVTTAGVMTLFPLPSSSAVPVDIALGSDGAMWFTERTGNRIGRISMAGAISEYPLPAGNPRPTSITSGPDGAMWFVEQNLDGIGRIAVDGTVTEFGLGATALSLGDVVTGSDGAIWFTEQATNQIGRMTLDGTVTRFTVPTPNSSPAGLALGPDGNVWFTEKDGNAIGAISPSGSFAEFSVPTAGSGPFGIAGGPDANVWFTGAFSDTIGRLNLPLADPPPDDPPPDTTAPTITILSPVDGVAVLGIPGGTAREGMAASFTCTDEAGGSGLATCVGSVPNGSALDLTPGVHSLTVTATDLDGNTASLTHSYIVFASWKSKLDLPPAWSTVKAGTPIRVSFDIGSKEGPDVFAAGSPSSAPVDCVTGAPLGGGTAASGDLKVKKHSYAWHWDTLRAWKGTCRALTMDFAVGDGVAIQLLVRFN
jgi:streptogramin lyase